MVAIEGWKSMVLLWTGFSISKLLETPESYIQGVFLIFNFWIFNNSVNFQSFFILKNVIKSQLNGLFDGSYWLNTKRKESDEMWIFLTCYIFYYFSFFHFEKYPVRLFQWYTLIAHTISFSKLFSDWKNIENWRSYVNSYGRPWVK